MPNLIYADSNNQIRAHLVVSDHGDILAAFLQVQGYDGREALICGSLVQDTGGRFDASRLYAAPSPVWPQAPKPSLTEHIGSFHVEKVDKELDEVVVTYDFLTSGMSLPAVDFSPEPSYPERTTGTRTLELIPT